ncbi:hypothetical protein [Clostridium sp.]|uniref:hypothetical protein n=1 Tax=Clostridium sp. TaxID=1506 RepID=UPI002FC7C089
MKFKKIDEDNVNKIKKILLENSINNNIELIFNNFRAEIKITDIEKSYSDDRKSAMIALLNTDIDEKYLCIKCDDKDYKLYLYIGEWDSTYSYDFDDVHIALGSNHPKLSLDFAELDISQALEDEHNIYLVKKSSKLAGKGTMARLNNGAGTNRELKFERRKCLSKRLRANNIPYGNEAWLCINVINKDELNSNNKNDEIFYKFLCDFLNYAFTIEDIVVEN